MFPKEYNADAVSNRIITVRLIRRKGVTKACSLANAKTIAQIITGFSTLLLSGISLYYVHGVNSDKEELAAAKLRQETLTGFSETDPAKKEIAAITLAAYGESALPTIRGLMSASRTNGAMADFGIKAVQHWMDTADSAARCHMMEELLSDAKSNSAGLREGAYKALVSLSGSLSPEENRQILDLMIERFGSLVPSETDAKPHMPETDTGVAKTACPLLNIFAYSDIRVALKNIANSNAAERALDSYNTRLEEPKQKLSADFCGMILKDLNELSVPSVGDSLKTLADVQALAARKCNQSN